MSIAGVTGDFSSEKEMILLSVLQTAEATDYFNEQLGK